MPLSPLAFWPLARDAWMIASLSDGWHTWYREGPFSDDAGRRKREITTAPSVRDQMYEQHMNVLKVGMLVREFGAKSYSVWDLLFVAIDR
jgi:hypothetical protein